MNAFNHPGGRRSSRAAQACCEIIPSHAFARRLEGLRQPYHANYFAMYSSLFDGIITDPTLMLVPFDDHMVHRGDGVFEVLRCINGALYNLEAHLKRLARSARPLGLAPPFERAEMISCIAATVCAGGHRDGMVRINLSRGPGGFSADPAEAPACQLYVVIYRPPLPFMRVHPSGARIITFSKPLRHFIRPVIKSCNYLFNVLMKIEAADQAVDFAIARDENGYLAEGATESIAWVSRRGELVFPASRQILRGTTAARVEFLARRLIRDGLLRGIRHSQAGPATVRSSQEVLLLGTSIDVVAVVEFDGHRIGKGRPGPVASALGTALQDDMRTSRTLLTPVMR